VIPAGIGKRITIQGWPGKNVRSFPLKEREETGKEERKEGRKEGRKEAKREGEKQ
jgi:hypothetical protein